MLPAAVRPGQPGSGSVWLFGLVRGVSWFVGAAIVNQFMFDPYLAACDRHVFLGVGIALAGRIGEPGHEAVVEVIGHGRDDRFSYAAPDLHIADANDADRDHAEHGAPVSRLPEIRASVQKFGDLEHDRPLFSSRACRCR
jgi:hypothetical protein